MMRAHQTLLRCAAIAVLLLAPQAASAQRTPPPAPVSAEVVSDLQARTLQLEQLVQQLTGQIEELRFQNQQLTKQLQRTQDDLTLRVTRLEQGGGATAAAPPGEQMAPTPAPAPSSSGPAPRASYDGNFTPSDKFDPNAPMSSPVAPQPNMSPRQETPASATTLPSNAVVTPTQSGEGGFTLRTDASGRALPPDPNAPRTPPPQAPAVPAPAPRAAPNPGAVAAAGLSAAPAVGVTLPQGSPKQQYDFAFDLLKRQDYARAEAAFREFVKQNPKDTLAGNAQYWLGESLYVRGDYQAAAVEFMNGYQQYPKSNKGPDNLLKLGMAMSRLNQAQGACTALGRIAKEYPDAPDEIRKTAQSERSKLKCT